MQVDAYSHNEYGEQQAVTENPPVAEGILKEELSYWLVENVGEQGTQQKESVVHALDQRRTMQATGRERASRSVYPPSPLPFVAETRISAKSYLAPEPGSTQRDPGMSKRQHFA